jgi:hypothetical protein
VIRLSLLVALFLMMTPPPALDAAVQRLEVALDLPTARAR